MPPPAYALSRRLEEFGLPLVAGGYADQPLGYLNDVMTVRGYLKARQAVESEYQNQDGVTVNPASPSARLLLETVEAEQWRQLAEEQG